MATAAPDLSLSRLWPGLLLWVVAGGWALTRLPADGSAGLWLGALWAALLLLRWLPWTRWGWPVPRIAGLCCPAPQPRTSDIAMGWMMGTLWWHAEGCLGSSVPAAVGVVLHLLVMVFLAQAVRRLAAPWQHPLAVGSWGTVTVLLLCFGAAAQTLWLCMFLLTLAWACEPPGALPGHLALQRLLLLVGGPLGLWAIHLRWPLLGPDALVLPFLLLALLACVTGLLSVPRQAPRVLNSGGSA
jgi:hypothetical protein